MKVLKKLFGKIGKLILPFLFYAIFGIIIEIFDRAITGSMIGYRYESLMGYASLWDIFVFGTGGLILSVLNDIPRFYKLRMIWQTLIGGSCVILTELIYGLIFNVWLGLNLWDYSDKINFMGQICLTTSLLWLFATPAFIWLTDLVGYLLYREEWKYHILDNYKELFTLK